MKKGTIIALVISVLLGACGGYYLFVKKSDQKDNIQSTQAQKKTTKQSNSTSLILPKVSLVQETQNDILSREITGDIYETIIVVSGDVANDSPGDIQVYTDERQSSNVSLELNKEIYDIIVYNKIASPSSTIVKGNGIDNILQQIVKYSPKSKYLLLGIKSSASKDTIGALAESLGDKCSKNCLMISIANPSGHDPLSLTKIHDQFLISALKTFNYQAIWNAESDSPQSLYLAAKFAELGGAKSFNLINRGNIGDEDTSSDLPVSSYIAGEYSFSESEEEKTATFIIGGDTMLDRDVWHYYKNEGIEKVFSGLGDSLFGGVDLSLLNLEGPISDIPISDDWPERSLVFNMPPSTINALKYAKINAVSLANNHTSNAGASGFAATQRLLKEAGINYAGRQVGFNKDRDVLRIESGIPISVLTIDALTLFDEDVFIQAISAEKQAGRFVIIMPHWGEEYNQKHNTNQENLAKSWINSGADIIIGSHPHVIQDMEIVNGKPVIYSLGNLVFDQYFSKATQQGLIVAGLVTEDKITLSFLPAVQTKSIPKLATGDDKTNVMNYLFNQTILTLDGVKKIGLDSLEIIR